MLSSFSSLEISWETKMSTLSDLALASSYEGNAWNSCRVSQTRYNTHKPFQKFMGWNAANLNRHSGFYLSWAEVLCWVIVRHSRMRVVLAMLNNHFQLKPSSNSYIATSKATTTIKMNDSVGGCYVRCDHQFQAFMPLLECGVYLVIHS